MYKELFRIVDGVVQPVNEREATIREVRIILNRDKGSAGDADGRKKKFAYKELGMVYWIGDYRSPGRMAGYEGKDLIENGIKNFGLPDIWMPDKVVSDLIKIYEDHTNGGVPAQTLSEIMATFNIMLQTTKKIREKLREKLLAPTITDAEFKDLIALQSQLLTLAADIPKKIKDIVLAKEMLKHIEDDEVEVGRGDEVITQSMRTN